MNHPLSAGSRPTARAWCALGLLNLLLISPVLVNEISVRMAGEHDKLFVFNAPASILWVVLLHALVRRPFRLHLALFPLYFLVGCDLYLVLVHQVRLSSSSISVVLDNWENAWDYVITHAKGIGLSLGIGLPLYVVGLLQLRGTLLTPPRRARAATALALVLVYGAVFTRQVRELGLKAGLLDVVSHDRNSPLGVVPQAVIAYVVFRDTLEHERASAHFHFGARRDGDAGSRRIVVLVLGESARYDHFGIYGYARETTPRLGARSDLVVFEDVTCQAPLTKLSVPLIITRGDIDHVEQYSAEKSIVTAYREAGYRTAWFSTQQRDQWTGAINRYTDESAEEAFYERRHDGVLVDRLKLILDEVAQSKKDLMVVLHTQGSHFPYPDRYPPEFRRFPDSGVSGQEALVNAYDDSILYTDYVLDSIIATLDRQGVASAMLYVSDHGENLHDDDRNLLGHFFGNQYDVPIPMILWTSREWIAAEPELAETVRSHRTLRLSTTSDFYTLADLGRVAIDGDDRFATRSLMRSTFAEQPRRFLAPSQVVMDFDERYPDHHEHAIAQH